MVTVQQHADERRLQNGANLEDLTCCGCSGDNEDTGPDNGADSQPGQRPWPQRFAQPVLWVQRIREQLINALGLQKLGRQTI